MVVSVVAVVVVVMVVSVVMVVVVVMVVTCQLCGLRTCHAFRRGDHHEVRVNPRVWVRLFSKWANHGRHGGVKAVHML